MTHLCKTFADSFVQKFLKYVSVNESRTLASSVCNVECHW